MGTPRPKVSVGRPRVSARSSAARARQKPKVGSQQPELGSGLADALFTSTQQRVLGLLFGQPEREFQQVELVRLAGGGSGAVQRELSRLVSAGLVTERQDERRKYLRANPSSALFSELCAIVTKTRGVAVALRAALAPRSADLQCALLFGSVAKGDDRAESDIDVLIVSDVLTLEDTFALLAPVEAALGRTVNPTLYTQAEFLRRRSDGNHFLKAVLAGSYTLLCGGIP